MFYFSMPTLKKLSIRVELFSNIMIFVVSMHRSGSSLLAGLLNDAGLNFGNPSRLIAADSSNKKGYWERKDVVQFNEAFFEKSGSTSSFPNDLAISSIEVDPRLTDITNELERDAVDVLKDPRFCFTLSVWASRFENPQVVLLVRNPMQVAQSLHRRQSMPLRLGASIWERYNRRAVKEILASGLDYQVIHFDALVNDPEGQTKQLLESLGLQTSDAGALGEFYDAGLVNNAIKLEDAFDQLTQDQINLYNSLLDGGLDTVDPREPDSLLTTLDLASEFVNLGYDPRHGRCVDSLAQNQLLELEEGKSYLSRKLKSTKDFYEAKIESSSRFYSANLQSQRESFKNKQKEHLLNSKMLSDKISKLNAKLMSSRSKVTDLTSLLDKNRRHLATAEETIEDQQSKLRSKDYTIRELHLRSRSYRHLSRNLFAHFYSDLQRIAKIPGRAFFKSITRYSLVDKAKNFVRLSRANGLGKAVAVSFKKVRESDRVTRAQSSVRRKDVDRPDLVNSLVSNLEELQNSRSVESFLIDSFCFEFYSAKVGIDFKNLNDGLLHYFSDGVKAGHPGFPLFDEGLYRAGLISLGIDSNVNGTLFEHWLSVGRDLRIVPTTLFNESFYIENYGSSLQAKEWSFERFVTVSVFNNCSPHFFFQPNWYLNHHNLKSEILPAFYHYLLKGSVIGFRPSPLFPAFSREHCSRISCSPMEYVLKETSLREKYDNIEKNERLKDIVSRVARYAPEIHQPTGFRRINLPPYNNPLFPAIKSLRRSLKEASYETIVVIPHCRVGGAAKVAGLLCETLFQLEASGKTLLVRTDNDDFMRPDWFPHEIEQVNLLDFGPDLPDVFRKKLLLDLFLGLKPKRIFNVHSRLAWIVFQEYGDRLKEMTSLYGYSFCYDVGLTGRKVGYPVKYVPSTIENLKSLLVDNHFLKNDLISTNKWGEELAKKVAVIHTAQPVDTSAPSWRRDLIKGNKLPKKVFWAGRFDRQKRFDLVIRIAKKMPDIDFQVWGKAMLGEDLEQSSLPPNITLNGLFTSVEELPLQDCGAWLYTSQWDGVPTLLLQLGALKVPIVATRVWGTSDIINEQTAWPVDSMNDVNEYVKGLRFFLDDPLSAERKGKTLYSLIKKQHSRKAYQAVIKALIEGDRYEKFTD